MPAVVSDSRGQPVTGLGQDNFRIFEDGRQQPLVAFHYGEASMTLGLIVDRSQSMRPKAAASGHVIEARKDPHRGVIATLLVEEGTLSRGDVVVAGMGVGRVRTMQDSAGRTLKSSRLPRPANARAASRCTARWNRATILERRRRARRR